MHWVTKFAIWTNTEDCSNSLDCKMKDLLIEIDGKYCNTIKNEDFK